MRSGRWVGEFDEEENETEKAEAIKQPEKANEWNSKAKITQKDEKKCILMRRVT